MGAGQSGGVEVGGSSMGYQVLRVYPESPGSRAGLKAYFDFIVAIGNTRFNKENGSLKEILKASVDQKLKMVVYNTRTKSTREVEIVPTTSWGGNGLLGVSIKHSSFDRADERVWHVVEVEPRSPAEQAGFKAREDYVIGSDSILQENDDLYNLVEAHEGKALKLFVYNVNTDNCREVICHPNSRWGGKGYLGCEFGHGLLHRIPYVDKGGDLGEENLRASLLRNEQPVATQPSYKSQIPSGNNHDSSLYNSPIMQNQMQALQRSAAHPGQQLFQQALFSQVSPGLGQQPTQKPSPQYQAPASQAPPTGHQLNQQPLLAQQQQPLPPQQQQQPPPPPPQQQPSPVQQLQQQQQQQQTLLGPPPPPPSSQLQSFQQHQPPPPPPPQQHQQPPPPLPPQQQHQPPPPPPQQQHQPPPPPPQQQPQPQPLPPLQLQQPQPFHLLLQQQPPPPPPPQQQQQQPQQNQQHQQAPPTLPPQFQQFQHYPQQQPYQQQQQPFAQQFPQQSFPQQQPLPQQQSFQQLLAPHPPPPPPPPQQQQQQQQQQPSPQDETDRANGAIWDVSPLGLAKAEPAE